MYRNLYILCTYAVDIDYVAVMLAQHPPTRGLLKDQIWTTCGYMEHSWLTLQWFVHTIAHTIEQAAVNTVCALGFSDVFIHGERTRQQMTVV